MTNVLKFKCSNEEVFISPKTEKQVIEMYGLETVGQPIESDESIDYLVNAFAKNRAEMEKLKILETEHDSLVNGSGQKLVNWTYKEAPKLFDRVSFKGAYPELEKRFTKAGEPCRAFSVLVKVV